MNIRGLEEEWVGERESGRSGMGTNSGRKLEVVKGNGGEQWGNNAGMVGEG